MTKARPLSIEIPAVETERLVLRGFRLDDFERHAAIWADPQVTQHISGRPFTREESWGRFLRHAGHWCYLGYGYWALEEKGSGRLVGQVGFGDFKRDIQPSIEGVPEMGWVLAPWSHGQGYATEAVKAALGWLDATLGRDSRSVCLIAPENLASLRVAEKCGYREYFRTTYHDAPTILFER